MRAASWCVARGCATLCLCFINVIFLLGGLAILLGSLSISRTDWIGVLKSAWTGTSTLLSWLHVIGIVVIVIALLGTIAGCLRWRLGLSIYSTTVSLLIIVFVVVAVTAFGIQRDVNHWIENAYPATNGEVQVKKEFDSVWCYAQGAYICNSMTVDDGFKLFIPNVPKSTLLDQYKGINALCEGTGSLANLILPEVKTVCDGCKITKQFKNFSGVLEWANNQCPRTESTLLWCGSYIITNNTNHAVGTAPYSQCRKPFLNLLSQGSGIIGWECIINVICGVLVIFCAFFLRRQNRTECSQDCHEMRVMSPSHNHTNPPITAFNKA